MIEIDLDRERERENMRVRASRVAPANAGDVSSIPG